MGYFIILVLGFLAPFIHTTITRERDYDLAPILGLLTAFLSVIPIIIISVIISAVSEQEEYIQERIEMVALKDNISTSGNFFLGSGSIDSEMTYFYMTKEEKGYKIDKVSGDDVYIVEDSSKTPVIEKYDMRFKNKKLEYWFPYWFGGDTVITIPENSIIYNYRVDLE